MGLSPTENDCDTHLWVVLTEKQVNSCIHTSFLAYDWLKAVSRVVSSLTIPPTHSFLLGLAPGKGWTSSHAQKKPLGKELGAPKILRQHVPPQQCVPKRPRQRIDNICCTIIRDSLGLTQSVPSPSLFHRQASRALTSRALTEVLVKNIILNTNHTNRNYC